jgi:uncharacterized repeat protein (TIGR03806 family)
MTRMTSMPGRARLAGLVIAAAALLGACGGGGGDAGSTTPPTSGTPPVQIYDQTTAPSKLSAWHLLLNDGSKLTLNQGVVPYDLNSALFSDYAFKLRTVYVPAGKQVGYGTDGTLDFPIGTVIAKTFYYPKATGTDAAYLGVARQSQSAQGDSIDLAGHRLVETRILVRQPDGTWSGLPYVWDADQKDATLTIGGADIKIELVDAGSSSSEKFVYGVPNASTCQQCHSTETAGGRGILPIGPKARNLNRSYAYTSSLTANQLAHWDDLKMLSGFSGLAGAPVNADWRDTTQSLDARAKAYLDVNCAHCHGPRGAASQTGLMLNLETIGTASPSTALWGVCKKPLAYGGPGAPYQYDIEPGQADASLILYRLSHTTTADVMPAVGRKVNHTEAINLVRDWISQIVLPACN